MSSPSGIGRPVAASRCATLSAAGGSAAADAAAASAPAEGAAQGAGEARQERSVRAIGRAAAAVVLGAEPEESNKCLRSEDLE